MTEKQIKVLFTFLHITLTGHCALIFAWLTTCVGQYVQFYMVWAVSRWDLCLCYHIIFFFFLLFSLFSIKLLLLQSFEHTPPYMCCCCVCDLWTVQDLEIKHRILRGKLAVAHDCAAYLLSYSHAGTFCCVQRQDGGHQGATNPAPRLLYPAGFCCAIASQPRYGTRLSLVAALSGQTIGGRMSWTVRGLSFWCVKYESVLMCHRA